MQVDDPTFPLWPHGGGPAGAPRRPRGGSALRRGDVLGRYFILQEIGRGGMGVVYAAYDPELDRKVALKILHPERAGRDDGVGRARLLREAKALARLSHPHVIQVHDAGAVEGQVFLAMELVVGTPLDVWLRQPRPWREVLAVFQAAGRGLAAAHAVGLVHRDFKPANVLLGDDGRVRVLDFGIARTAIDEEEILPPEGAPAGGSEVRLTTQLTREGVALGTPRYMAPEVLLGRMLDHRVDQYSFCVALYEALYGIAPYAGDTLPDLLREVLAGRLQEPAKSSGAARVPAWIRRILLRGLETDPERRYPTMDALLADLAEDRTSRRRRWASIAAAVVLLAAGGVALFRLESRPSRLCTGAAAKLAGIWDADRKTALRRAFLASGRPFAADAWNGSEQALDAYARAWTGMRTEACEATHLRGEQSAELLDLRMHCLDRRLGEVRALTGLFASGDPGVVEKAVAASRGLSSLEQCADAVALTAPVPPPAGASSRRAVAGIEARIAEARALWTTGRFADGLKAATAATDSAARLGYPPVQAEALQVRALNEDALSRFETAEATLFSALAAAEKGHHDALAARAWIDLVWVVGFRESRFADGERWAQIAEAALVRLGGGAENPELEADLWSNLGSVRSSRGDHAGGIELLRRSLAAYEKTLGPDHSNVSRTLNRLGGAYYQAERYTEALGAYERALQQSKRILGPRHPTVAIRLGNIALALEAQERYEESLATQLQAIAIEESALGPGDPRVGVGHGNLSGLLLTMGRPEEALGHARRAVAIDQSNPDTPPADLGASFLNLADVLFKLERYPEALLYNGKARELLTKSVGESHSWTAAANASYGQILLAQRRPAEAVAPLRRAVTAFAAAGDETPASGAARFTLARALWDSGGDRREALALARQAREILSRTARRRAKEVPEIDAWLAAR